MNGNKYADLIVIVCYLNILSFAVFFNSNSLINRWLVKAVQKNFIRLLHYREYSLSCKYLYNPRNNSRKHFKLCISRIPCQKQVNAYLNIFCSFLRNRTIFGRQIKYIIIKFVDSFIILIFIRK
jgi:hypothetical protein